MAGSILQEKVAESTAASTNISVTLASAVTAASAIHAIADYGNATALTCTYSDGTNTYTSNLDNTADGANNNMNQGYALNCAAGTTTVKVTLSGTPSYHGIWAREVGGVSTSAIDNHGGASVTGPNPSFALTLNTAPGIISAVCAGLDFGNAITAGAGWTAGSPSGGTVFQDNNGVNCSVSESQHFTTSGSKTVLFTDSQSDPDILIAMSFADAAGAAIADGAARPAFAPGLKRGTPTSKLRSGLLDTGTTPPPFIDQTAGPRPQFLRLGTPISRLRGAILDTGTTPPPFIDQTAGPQPRWLKLGTPVSRLRSAVLDTGTTQLTTGLLSAYGVSLSSATFDMTGSPGFLTVNAVSVSAAVVPPAGGVGMTGASASAAAIPPAGGMGVTGVSATTAAVEVDAGISASGVSGSTATVDFTGSPGFMNLPGVSASVAIFPLSPGAFFISASGASASTATFDMTGSPGFLTASAASASAAVFPLSGGIGMVGASASGVVFQLSGGISLFGVTASAAAFPLAGGVSFNGAAASAAIYTAVGVAANSIFLTGVAGSAGHLTLIGVSTVQNLHEIGLGGLMLRLGGRVGGN